MLIMPQPAMSAPLPIFRGTDRFEVIRLIGSGGMGVVFEAFDRERNMRVALKLLPEIEPMALYRFKHEFRSLAELSHPNLVPFYELFADGDQWFFTMELLDDARDFFPKRRRRAQSPAEAAWVRVAGRAEGEMDSTMDATTAPMRALVDLPTTEADPTIPPLENPPSDLNYDRVRKVFAQVASGVSALHRAGKLHRDLKPGNVIVCRDGRVALLDFGLVKDLGPGEGEPSKGSNGEPDLRAVTLTSRGFLQGTLTYMSPEQVEGKPLTVASDWYAVGVMLYETLTGRVPFHDKGKDFLAWKLSRSPPPPSAICPGTPQDLSGLCVALLSRDPLARPTGEQALAALSPGADAGELQEQDQAPFVGRQDDLGRIEACWKRAQQGSAVTLRVHGPSGVGKTSLVRRFLDGLADPGGPMILCGRCYEQESVPFKALDSVVDALTHHLLLMREAEVEELLPEDAGSLARVFPVLSRSPAVAAKAAAEGSGGIDLREVQEQAFMALRELFCRIAKSRGLVVWVDDLQWGDADSGALLRHLMKPPDAPEMLLALTYRAESIGHSVCLAALEDAEDWAAGESLQLQPLSASDTRLLAQELLGPGENDQADWIVRESRGAAFFVYELARYIKSGAQFGLTEGLSVDAVLSERLRRLPPESLRVLELTAVAGEPLTLRTLQEAGGLQILPPHLITQLRSAHLVRTTGPGLDDVIEFFHDRVRETVDERVSPEARKSHHGALADALQALGGGAEKLAPHYEGAGRVDEAARCFLLAADEAVAALAFNRAEEFFRKAAALTKEPLERAEVQEKMIHFYTDIARFADAYQVAREAAHALGISLPARFNPALFARDFLLSKLWMRGMRPADVLERREMQDPRLIAAVRLMNAGAKAAYQVRPELCIAVSTQGVNLCLQHGITPDCAVCWMVYGAIFQGGILGRRQLGYDFGRLALGLLERFQNNRQRAEVNFVVGYFGTSWVRPAREAEELWKIAWQSGLNTGDLFHTGCAGAGLVFSEFMRGVPFDEVLAEADRILPTLERAGLREPAGVIHAVRQAIRNLRGQTLSPESFSDADFDEDRFRSEIAAYGSRHFAHMYFIVRMKALYFHGLHEQASHFERISAGYLKESPGMLHNSEHYFYSGLNSAALAERPGIAAWMLRRKVRSAHRRFCQWATGCPENFRARERILAAELARLDGKTKAGLAACEEARRAASSHGAVHLEGLADLAAARLHRAAGAAANAGQAFSEAHGHFRRWGAELRVPQ